MSDGRWRKRTSERVDPKRLHEAMQLRSRRQPDRKTALIRLNGKRYQASRELAGQRVQLRWPFDDDSAVNVYRNGAFVERAELFIPQSDIDYDRRPQRIKEEEPPVLDCSKKFRAALVAKFRREQPPEDTSRWGILTQREFTYVVEQNLGRVLDEAESGILAQAYKRLFPMDAEFVERSLQKAKAGKGDRMHIGFYVRFMEESRRTGGNSK